MFIKPDCWIEKCIHNAFCFPHVKAIWGSTQTDPGGFWKEKKIFHYIASEV